VPPKEERRRRSDSFLCGIFEVTDVHHFKHVQYNLTVLIQSQASESIKV
jgi:hypothetical protein